MSVLRILVGASVIGIIFYKLPVFEILTLFFYIVFVPLIMLASLGLIGSGVVDLVGGGWNEFSDELQRRVREQRDQLNKAAMAGEPA